MAKLTGPLLSMGAKGQIGKAMVVANWRGVDYARQYTVPKNPRTTAQQTNRTRFAFLREMWKLAPAAIRPAWEAFATGRPFLAHNKFVGENLRLITAAGGLEPLQISPGARGGLPPVSVVADPGAAAGEVDVTVEIPADLPDGWLVDSVVAGAVHLQDASGVFDGIFKATTAANDAAPLTIAGLTTGETAVAAAFIVYEMPNGKLAYSVSLSDTAVVT